MSTYVISASLSAKLAEKRFTIHHTLRIAQHKGIPAFPEYDPREISLYLRYSDAILNPEYLA